MKNNLIICLAIIYLFFFGVAGVRDAYLANNIGGMIFPGSSFFVIIALFSLTKRANRE